MEYIDNLLDYEMIFIEFCELIFFISRKYFIFHGMNKEEEMNTINSNNKSQITKKGKTKYLISSKRTINTESDGEKEINENKEIKEAKEPKDLENYKIIINYIKIEKDKLKEQDKYRGINKYNYPLLKTHQMIYKQIEDEEKENSSESFIED